MLWCSAAVIQNAFRIKANRNPSYHRQSWRANVQFDFKLKQSEPISERTLILIVSEMWKSTKEREFYHRNYRHLSFLSAFESLHPHTSPKIYRLLLSHLRESSHHSETTHPRGVSWAGEVIHSTSANSPIKLRREGDTGAQGQGEAAVLEPVKLYQWHMWFSCFEGSLIACKLTTHKGKNKKYRFFRWKRWLTLNDN